MLPILHPSIVSVVRGLFVDGFLQAAVQQHVVYHSRVLLSILPPYNPPPGLARIIALALFWQQMSPRPLPVDGIVATN